MKSEKIWKMWKKGKLNSEMIWKIWKISVLVIITPTFFVFIELFNGYLFVYLSVCFMFSLVFSVSTSRQNTTNVLSLTQQQQHFPLTHSVVAAAAAIYPRAAAAIALKFHPKHFTNTNKTKHIHSQQNSD